MVNGYGTSCLRPVYIVTAVAGIDAGVDVGVPVVFMKM
jgi:hypothetical protein